MANSGLPSLLPDSAVSRQGLVFDPRCDDWRLSSSSQNVHISFVALRAWATPALVDSLKLALSVEARRLAARTIRGCMDMAVVPLLRHAHACNQEAQDQITLAMVQAFNMTLDTRHKHWLHSVKMLAVALTNHGDPAHGIEPQALAWLHRQKIGTNPKGEATLTWHPEKGPLLQIEDRILMTGLHSAFEADCLPLHIYLKALLFRLSGMRPSQIADLKCKDLTLRDGVYYLNCPQAKGRGGIFRGRFEEWALTPEVGALLAGFIAQQKNHWKHLGCNDEELPLFPNPRNPDPVRRFHLVGGSIAKEIPDYLTRLTVPDPVNRERVQIQSPRTGRPFKVNMKRFRISLATWALQRGATLMEVATLLGHSNIDNVMVYAAIDPEELEEMDRKMAASEIITAGYFRGELVNAFLSDAKPVYTEHFSGSPLGACPCHCALRKPVACYPCGQFRAFMEGPHEQVLHDLLEERDLIQRTGGTAQVNTHDLSVQAVKEVIHLRDERLRRDGLTLQDLQAEEGA